MWAVYQWGAQQHLHNLCHNSSPTCIVVTHLHCHHPLTSAPSSLTCSFLILSRPPRPFAPHPFTSASSSLTHSHPPIVSRLPHPPSCVRPSPLASAHPLESTHPLASAPSSLTCLCPPSLLPHPLTSAPSFLTHSCLPHPHCLVSTPMSLTLLRPPHCFCPIVPHP